MKIKTIGIWLGFFIAGYGTAGLSRLTVKEFWVPNLTSARDWSNLELHDYAILNQRANAMLGKYDIALRCAIVPSIGGVPIARVYNIEGMKPVGEDVLRDISKMVQFYNVNPTGQP